MIYIYMCRRGITSFCSGGACFQFTDQAEFTASVTAEEYQLLKHEGCQASVAVEIRSSIFSDFKQRRLGSYWRFGTT